MFSIDLMCTPEEKDLTIAELWEAGCTGIVELGEGSLADTPKPLNSRLFPRRHAPAEFSPAWG